MWLQPCSRPIRAPMYTSVRSLSSASWRIGVKTHHAVRAPAISRNHASAARPRLRRTLLSIRPIMRELAPFGQGHRFSGFGSDVLRLRADEAIVGDLLEHMRSPAGSARHGERGREEFLGQADGL